jgi:hypothetical protein
LRAAVNRTVDNDFSLIHNLDMSALTKSHRLILILEVIEPLKVATPAQVLASVAKRSQSDPDDPNLRRAVYRDLSELADQGRLLARYLMPDGSEITPDQAEEHRNLRIEYRLPESGGDQIPGIGVLEKMGGGFLRPALKSMGWRFSPVENISLAKNLSLLFRYGHGKTAAIQLSLEQAPASLLLTRPPDGHKNFKPLAQEIERTYGARTAALLCWDPSVSRSDLNTRLGHCLLSLESSLKLEIQDLKSSSGTYISALPDNYLEMVQKWLALQNSSKTQPNELNPFQISLPHTPVPNSPLTIPSACRLIMGDFRVLCLVVE